MVSNGMIFRLSRLLDAMCMKVEDISLPHYSQGPCGLYHENIEFVLRFMYDASLSEAVIKLRQTYTQ